MANVREFFESSIDGARALEKEYKKWAIAVRERSRKLNIELPPFVIYDTFSIFEGPDGLVIAIHHAHHDAFTRTVYTDWGQVGKNDRIIEKRPINNRRILEHLVKRQWNPRETTLFKLSWDQPVCFESLWKQHLTECQRKQESKKTLGTDDVTRHLSNAKAMLESPNETDWGNAKSQARKALETLAMNITGENRVKGIAKYLKKRSLLGKTEVKWFERFEDLLGSTYNLASKKGAHKPDPRQAEAVFCVKVVAAIVDYVISVLTDSINI